MLLRWFAVSILSLSAVFGQSPSFAPQPPQTEGVKKLFAKQPKRVGEAVGRPLPTNDWWTSLLSDSPYPGKMYAYPLTISADAGSLKLWYPKGWNQNGTMLVEGEPLLVEPVDPNPPETTSKLLYDFEQNWDELGWALEGTAFGPRPMNVLQQRSTGFIGKQFACSFYGGDGGIGTATSPEFDIDHEYLHIKVAGGDDRSQLGVHLMVGGASVHQAVGKKSNDLEWQTWDLRKYKGQQAQIRIVDESKGGWGFISCDQTTLSAESTPPSDGAIAGVATKNWGDWSVEMRLLVAEGKHADVTFGRGMPYTWIQTQGVDLRIPLGGGTVRKEGGVRVMERQGRLFGIHGPGGQFVQQEDALLFRGPLLAVSVMEDVAQAAVLQQHAAAVPEDTRFDWKYDPSSGVVETVWRVVSDGPFLQGWAPHHYRTTTNDLTWKGGEYASRRGRLRLASGNRFSIVWPFTGMVPQLPLPEAGSGFDSARLGSLVEGWGRELLSKPEDNRHARDSYWGGKSMLKVSQASVMAKQLEHPIAPELLAEARRIATDWLSHSTGEEARYYARYPAPWNGLVGFGPSYGSEQFTDNHFHYGYLVFAAAMVGAEDPEWLATFGPAAREVARQYANWQRDSKDQPRLRTFEPWAGHSYAGGMSSFGDGNNQESSSEAMGAWAALFFLGSVMGDEEMLATGAMGYAIEAEAFHEYWNNSYGWENPELSNWPASYQPTICSVVRDRDIGAWTWFSGEPIHIYGIQWLPGWTHSHYMGRHREHAVFQLDQMMTRQGKHKNKGKLDWEKIDGDWGQVAAGFGAWSQPEAICEAFDSAFAAKWPISSHKHAGVPYYLAHANRALGVVDLGARTSMPTSLVFKGADGKRLAVLWNPGGKAEQVSLFDASGKVGTVAVPPGELLCHEF